MSFVPASVTPTVDLAHRLALALRRRAVLDQAVGVLSCTGLSPEAAIAQIQDAARADGTTLVSTAQAVLDRTVRRAE